MAVEKMGYDPLEIRFRGKNLSQYAHHPYVFHIIQEQIRISEYRVHVESDRLEEAFQTRIVHLQDLLRVGVGIVGYDAAFKGSEYPGPAVIGQSQRSSELLSRDLSRMMLCVAYIIRIHDGGGPCGYLPVVTDLQSLYAYPRHPFKPLYSNIYSTT